MVSCTTLEYKGGQQSGRGSRVERLYTAETGARRTVTLLYDQNSQFKTPEYVVKSHKAEG
jgi:hypothetical protein